MTKYIALILAAAGLCATAAFAGEAATEKAPSEHSVALGFTLTDGNSDTLLGTASYLFDRKRDEYTLRLALDGAYGENDSEKNTENVKGVAEYRRSVSERVYWLGNLSALYDDIADVDYRVIASVGPGVYLQKNDKAWLGVEAGPAYIAEKVGGESRGDWALRVGERYERQLSATAKLWQSLEYLPLVDDFDDYLLNSEIGIEAAINSSASIRLIARNTYDSTPAPEHKKSDTTVIAALAYQL